MADRVGQQLGNYRLIRLLGRGGFAEVYLGEHLRLGTQAAVKVLHTRLASHDDVEGFEKEARTVARLKHPHIVRVLDYDVEDDTPFLVMDYAVGGTLHHRHPKGTRLPFTTIISYVKQTADALQYAHDQRVIHRDIKPENILVGEHNELLLSDFGIATIAHSSHSINLQQGIGGTLPYMAPEQIQGKPRPASDQYALGVVVYEWIAGQRPFQGTAVEIAMQHAVTAPPSLLELVPTLPRNVEQVVLTVLEKDPRKRFASVQAFATALEQASRVDQPHSSILSQPLTVPSQPRQPLTMTSPIMPLSQQTTTSTPIEEVHTPPTPPDQSRQVVSSSRLQIRSEPVPQRISRRASLLGLGVAGLVITGGYLTWLSFFQREHPSVISSQIPTTKTPNASPGPTSTPISLGMLLYTYRGHSSYVYTVAWSPDGTRIASGSYDKTVQVWDATDGSPIYTYRGHADSVNAVAWSPNGTYIASGSLDSTVQVWDATDGSHIYIYHGYANDRAVAVAWSPDGRRIAAGIAAGSDDKTVQMWDATDGSHIYTYRGHTNSVNAVAWSPDSTRVASGSVDKTVQVWWAG